MKKILTVLMILSLLAAMPFATLATSEPAEEASSLTGLAGMLLEGSVTELADGGFVLMDKEMGEVMVNTSDATVWGGLLETEELAVGQYVFVHYNGMTTRSLPPQVHADGVNLYMLSGMVTEILEDGSILMNDAVNGDVIVHLGEDMKHVNVGSPIVVYHNGVMTLSLPPQITASDIRLHQVAGVITEVTEDGFLLTTLDDAQMFMVNLGEETIYSEEALEEDIDADAMEAALSVEPKQPVLFEGEEMPEESEAEASSGETQLAFNEATGLVEEVVSESAATFAAGDVVTVYYNGAMTRSIPAQIYALEVVTLR